MWIANIDHLNSSIYVGVVANYLAEKKSVYNICRYISACDDEAFVQRTLHTMGSNDKFCKEREKWQL
jgi:hypothetical protein